MLMLTIGSPIVMVWAFLDGLLVVHQNCLFLSFDLFDLMDFRFSVMVSSFELFLL